MRNEAQSFSLRMHLIFPPPNKILDIDRNLNLKTEVKGREIVFTTFVWRATLWSRLDWNVKLLYSGRREKKRVDWSFSHDTDTGVGGKQLESFWDWIWNWETICERHGQKDREGKGSLMSQYSGSLHVSKNKVLKTLVTEKRGGARSIKISHLENKWHNSSFLVMASLQVVVMMFEADYGSSCQTGSGYVWWLSCWGDVRVPGLMMAAMEVTSPHKLCVMHPSLCAVCAYVHVCIWLYMRGVWAWGITRPLCTEHRRLSGWAVWPADKDN